MEDIACPCCQTTVFSESVSSEEKDKIPLQSRTCTHTVCTACIQNIQVAQAAEQRVKKWFPCPVCRQGKAFNITDSIVSHAMCLAVKSADIQISDAESLQPLAALIKSEAPATSDNEHARTTRSSETNSTNIKKDEPYLSPSPKRMKRCPDTSKDAALTVGESEEARSSADTTDVGLASSVNDAGTRDDDDIDDVDAASDTSIGFIDMASIGRMQVPSAAKNSGFDGLSTMVGDEAMPTSFEELFLLMDFLLGDEGVSYHRRLFVEAGSTTNGVLNGKRLGRKTRLKLRDLKEENPQHPSVSWHVRNKEWVPLTKDAMKHFIQLLKDI